MTALATRAALETAIAEWLDRSDLDDQIPDFIKLFEDQVNRVLRASRMIERCRGTTNDGYTEMPERWLEAISIRIPGEHRLVYKPAHELQDIYESEPEGTPRFYTLLGRDIQVAPAPASATIIEQVYYKRIVLGDEPTATNWLLETASDVYLFGALTMANAYLKHDERVQTWADRLSNAMTELNDASKRAQVSGGPLNRVNGGLGV